MTIEGYLLDTSVASCAWDGGHRHHGYMRGKLASIPGDLVFVCPVTLAEIEYGLLVSPLVDNQRHKLVREAMASYVMLPIDRFTYEPYATIRARLFRRFAPQDRRGLRKAKYIEDLREHTTGKELGITENDLWIVAVAVQYDLRFATNDGGGGMHRILEVADYLDHAEFWVP